MTPNAALDLYGPLAAIEARIEEVANVGKTEVAALLTIGDHLAAIAGQLERIADWQARADEAAEEFKRQLRQAYPDTPA